MIRLTNRAPIREPYDPTKCAKGHPATPQPWHLEADALLADFHRGEPLFEFFTVPGAYAVITGDFR